MTKIGLLVIDVQNKFKYIIEDKIKNNIIKVVERFDKNNLPIFFSQWSRCKYKHNCTKNHKKESMDNKIAFRYKRFDPLYKLEKTRKYKCPSKKCDIILPLKKYSNRLNTFVSNKMDTLANKKVYKAIKKAKIDKLYIIGGWGSHCVVSTALSCINNYNIMPYLIEDAIFDESKFKKIIPMMIDSIIPGCKTKELEI